MFKVKKQKEQILETIHDAEVLAGQLKAANEEIGERQSVANDQDEVIAVVYEELLAAEETIAAQTKTIATLKKTADAAKKAANEAMTKVKALADQISASAPSEGDTDETPVTEDKDQVKEETPADTSKEVD